MLRPYIHINVLNTDYSNNYSEFIGRPYINLYKYTIQPIEFSSEETREGISVSFSTKVDKKILKNGDKIQIDLGYKNIIQSQQMFPVLVVTDTQINADMTYNVVAIDEFYYYSQITTFIPQVETSTLESEYLKNTFGVTVGQEFVSKETLDQLHDINFKDLLGYIQLRIYHMFFYSDPTITDSLLIKFKNNLLFNLLDENTLTTTVGKFTIGSGVAIQEVIKILRESYFIRIYKENGTYYYNNDGVIQSNKVTVETIGMLPNPKNGYVKITDNVNIIENNLTFKNPLDVRNIYIDEYVDYNKNKDDEKKIDKVSDFWYGYYDNENNPVVTQTKPTKINFIQSNTFKVGNANVISKEQRKNGLMNKLKSKEYLGYEGTLNTFQFACNLNDVVELQFNNIDNMIREHSKYNDTNLKNYRENGLFGIESLTRTYDNSGLFMTINPRQKLTL